MKRYTFLMLLLVLLTLQAGAEGWIRINQLGYLPRTSKVAVLITEEPAAITSFELVELYTGQVVYTGTRVRATGPMGNMRGTWRLNFSDFTRPGTYYIKAGAYRSECFPIDGNVYNGTADFVLRYMRQQRCGFNPFLADSCHTHDGYVRYNPAREGQHIDVRGGWHDAADLLQYTMTSANAIYQMMLAYEQNPRQFADSCQANGLPGPNGVPDIVDEIKWGLDWLDRMNPAPGELYNQIADDRDHASVDIPTRDPVDYGWGKNNGRPVYYVDGRPQQRGKFKNATMGAASTAGKFASDFALGSELLKPFYPEFAAKIGAKAVAAYQVGRDKPGNTQTVSISQPYIYEEDNWVDDMDLGAMELYRITGDKNYLTQAMEYGRREPFTPWMGADSARHYQWYTFMNVGHYRLAQVKADKKLSHEFLTNLRTGIQRVWERGKDDPFMWGVPGIWCSNNLTTAMLTQCILYRQLSGDTTFAEMEGSLRDWLLGCNPWGTSMIVGLPEGGTYPTDPHSNYHFMHVGMPTGGLVDGPVYTTIFGSLLGVNLNSAEGNDYARFQPGKVVYHDKINDYSTNEPTMDGTAALTFPFSTYAAEGGAQADRFTWDEGGIVRGDSTLRQVCLIFSADSMYDGAPTIIKSLRQAGVKGAFFLTGHFYELHPDIVHQLVAEGHYVGSHSYGHLLYADWDKRDSTLVTKQEFQADMLHCYQLMAQQGITKDQAPWFMPPYEWYNATISSWARQMGLQVVDFTPGTRSNSDYTIPSMGRGYRSSKQVWQGIMQWEQLHGLNGHLLLIHLGVHPDRHDKFYRRLPALIKELRKRGYTFVSLPEMMKNNK